jgi:hypothetical protein
MGLRWVAPPAPHLANGWLSKYDNTIREDASIYARYMDDILRNMKQNEISQKLEDFNNLHPCLKFTIEREQNGSIAFLDMKIINENGKLSSTWYNKPTDTGLILNYHALAPKKYKRSVVSGFVHRIYRACSTDQLFHQSIEKAKKVLEKNQYPPSFYEPIFEQSINTILKNRDVEIPPTPVTNQPEIVTSTQKIQKRLLFVQYRGKSTEDYARALHRLNAPCTVVFTLRKLKTVLPSLKPLIEKPLRSGVVYQIMCPRCRACYVGQTCRHLQTRFKEHLRESTPVGKHFKKCKQTLTLDNIEILGSSARGEDYLMTLEALFINELRPTLNTKNEYRSRVLTIKF